MKNSNQKQEYRCKDNYTIVATLIMLLLGCFICIITLILVVNESINNTEFFMPDGLVVLIVVESMGFILIGICTYSLLTNKSCIFTINNSSVKLVGKKRKQNVLIEKNIDDIQKIVIKTFRKIKVIVLVDNTSTLGYWAASQNGEFIKLQYSKRKLNEIKRFLPNCPIEISENTELGIL